MKIVKKAVAPASTVTGFDKIKNAVAGMAVDADKFYNGGNKSAGTRLRKGLQILKGIVQDAKVESLKITETM